MVGSLKRHHLGVRLVRSDVASGCSHCLATGAYDAISHLLGDGVCLGRHLHSACMQQLLSASQTHCVQPGLLHKP